MANVAETKQMTKKVEIKTVHDFLESKRDLIASALPRTITPERMIGMFTMIIRNSPELMKCTQSSLISSVIQTIQLGLQPGNIGHVYLVPFNNKQKDGSFKKEVQLIVGYRGLCELVNRSGRAVVLSSEVVKENDIFEYQLGLEPRLKHVPADRNRGEVVGVYAIAKNLDANEKVFVYLQIDEINKIKNSSKAKSSKFSPWTTWPEEMMKKSAVKRLCKLLPLSAETQSKIGADETVKHTITSDIPNEPDKANWDAEEAEFIEPNDSGDEEVNPKDVPSGRGVIYEEIFAFAEKLWPEGPRELNVWLKKHIGPEPLEQMSMEKINIVKSRLADMVAEKQG